MTDNELNFLTVSQCVSSDYCKGYNEAIKKANEIINRQQAEIGNLNIELQAMRNAANGYKAEVKRLIEENEIKSQKRANIFEIVNAYERGKAEAVKEFVDKVLLYIPNTDGETTIKCVENAIKQTLKEMVGVDKK